MKEKDLLLKIGERIKELRTEKGISQQELAAALDIEKSNMSRLESGRVNMGVRTIYRIAQALDISMSELLDVE